MESTESPPSPPYPPPYPLLRLKPFDTELSNSHEELYHDDNRGFSPWIREKVYMQIHTQNQLSPQEVSYHRFLATVRISPRGNARIRRGEVGFGEMDSLKADLKSRINASRIRKCDYDDEKFKNYSMQTKNFFERRANLAKLYRRPKSINLSLEFDPKNILKCSPISKVPQQDQQVQTGRSERTSNRVRKFRQNQHQEDKKLSETMKDFRTNILQTQKKVYQTLELSIDNSNRYRNKKQRFVEPDQIPSKVSVVSNRPRFYKDRDGGSRDREKSKNERNLGYLGEMACLGKNAVFSVNIGQKVCRNKLDNIAV